MAWGAPRPQANAPRTQASDPSRVQVPYPRPTPSPLATEGPLPPVEKDEPPPSGDRRDEVKLALAELESVKRRVERDAARAEESTRGRLVTELLPVLDNLDRTIEVGSADEALLSGVKLVRAQLEGVLVGYGLERIVALGAPFDPAQHEAVAVARVDDREKDGVVTDELSRGYRLGGRVLVPARVRVGKMAA